MFMNKAIFLVLFLCVYASLFGQKNGELESSKLKVISYNIWNGFEWGKDTVRREKVIAWINSQKPDVVALQELCGFTEEKLSKLGEAWGHPYVEILKTSGYSVGITSEKPIDVKERILEHMHHGALHCQTYDIDFMVIHFSPFSYRKRHEEAEIILSKLMKIREAQNKYVVLGDFNAVSPIDADYYKANENKLKSMRESEEKHKHVRNLFYGQLEYGVISKYLSFPLIDVTQIFTTGLDQRISCPTQVFEKKKGEGRHPNSARIDYILTSPYLSKFCVDARVINGQETYYLSDHYPVVAEFNF